LRKAVLVGEKTERMTFMNWTKTYKKAVTFSYDDGVTPDLKLLEIFNKYGIKCTFNLNYGLGPVNGGWECNGKPVNRLDLAENAGMYAGHEVAAHALTHPDLTKLDVETVTNELTVDKTNLETFFGTKITGMAYPYGTHNEEVRALVKKAGLHYARTVHSTNAFDLPADLLQLPATCHHRAENLMELAKQFVELKTDTPQLFYVWGHSYEFDVDNNWDRMEEFCKYISGRDDIFYGTNYEVLSPLF